jgi:hypothetical protein
MVRSKIKAESVASGSPRPRPADSDHPGAHPRIRHNLAVTPRTNRSATAAGPTRLFVPKFQGETDRVVRLNARTGVSEDRVLPGEIAQRAKVTTASVRVLGDRRARPRRFPRACAQAAAGQSVLLG